MARDAGQPALHDELMARVLDRANLQRAWKRVKANRGAPGIDGLGVEDWPTHAAEHWAQTRRQLEAGSYRPQPVRRVMIPKRSGGERPLGIPTVTDRVIQQAIAQVLTPIFDPGFSTSSHGFRPERSAHGALEQVRGHLKAGHRIAVDLDVLMARVARKVRDPRLLALIGRYLRAGVLNGEDLHATDIGTPQGGPLSPLLANILLDDLDRELERRGHRFVRYADDVMILVESERAGERVMASISRYLTKTLKFTVNAHKSRVVPTDQATYLGYTFRGTKLRWSDDAFADFQHRIRQLTGRSWGVSMAYRLYKLAQYLRGWLGYFGKSEYYRPIPEIDAWIRRRLRMCYWKQWRRVRTKIKHLLALGVGKRQAILTGLSSKSYWHLSKTQATQMAMSNDWLERQGLISVRTLWLKAQGYA